MKLMLFRAGKGLTLPIKIVCYDTFWRRFSGLMFRFKPIVDEAILIQPCNSIHMFFMFFAIDVVFVNESGVIVFCKEDVRPWTAIFSVKYAKSALELPVGTISKYGFQIGDKLIVG